jgi:hypothetical protein
MPVDLPLDALEMALWIRARTGHADPDGRLTGLIHHSDAGSVYTALRYVDRLDDAGALASIGTVGDSLLTGQSSCLCRSATRRGLVTAVVRRVSGATSVAYGYRGGAAA